MARNKHPRETVQKILEVSYRLFAEKGYDHTTIQDIVDALGMSKGAVYHHFKSKEDILDKITTGYYDSIDWFSDVRADTSLTGLEKLRKILLVMLTDQRKLALDHISMSMKLDPRMLALVVNSTMNDTCPFSQEIVEEGVRDGSITTRHPKELNQVFMLLLNVWVGLYVQDQEDFMRKVYFIKEMTDQLGMPVIDDALLQAAGSYFGQIIDEVRQRGWLPTELL